LTVGKEHSGIAEKPHDKFTLPLCNEHHRAQHEWGNERDWWAKHEIDPVKLALALYASADYEEAHDIIRNRQ
jgi:hypothetical protein